MAEEEEGQQEEGQEEESAVQKKDDVQGGAAAAPNNSKLVFIVLIVNVVALIGVAAIVWLNLSKSSDSVSLKDIEEQRQTETAHVAEGESEASALQYIEENFMVNLSGSGGSHYAKLGVSIQVENDFVKAELEKIRPKIRDFIIVMLSSKSVEQVSSADGVEFLREEIRNKINGYLTKGEVDQVLITQFIVQ